MKKCHQCSSEMPDTAEFCINCAAMSPGPHADKLKKQLGQANQPFTNQESSTKGVTQIQEEKTNSSQNKKAIIAIAVAIFVFTIIGTILLFTCCSNDKSEKSSSSCSEVSSNHEQAENNAFDHLVSDKSEDIINHCFINIHTDNKNITTTVLQNN